MSTDQNHIRFLTTEAFKYISNIFTKSDIFPKVCLQKNKHIPLSNYFFSHQYFHDHPIFSIDKL